MVGSRYCGATVTVALLLAGLGSVSVAAAASVTFAGSAVSALNWTTSVAVAPAGMVPRLQLRLLPLTLQLPAVVVADCSDSVDGSVVVTVTLCAAAAPRLMTTLCSVGVGCVGSPRNAPCGWLSVILRSAWVRSIGWLMVALQLPSEVTLVDPIYVLPWPNPEGSQESFLKNSMVKLVLGLPLKEPCAVNAVPETATQLEKSEVLPLGSVAVALRRS